MSKRLTDAECAAEYWRAVMLASVGTTPEQIRIFAKIAAQGAITPWNIAELERLGITNF